MYKLHIALFIALLCAFQKNAALAQKVHTIQIQPGEKSEAGFFFRKVPLQNSVVPAMQVYWQDWQGMDFSLPKGNAWIDSARATYYGPGPDFAAATSDAAYPVSGAAAITLQLGPDRRQPFALLKIPAYRQSADGKWYKLTSMTVLLTEPEP